MADAPQSDPNQAGQSQDKPQQPVTAIAHLHVSDEDKRENRTYQKRNLCLQALLTVGTWLAFGAAAYYAHVAKKQSETMNQTYGQIRQQTTLTRQQLEGTMGALIKPRVSLPENGQGGFTLEIELPNDGHVTASSAQIPEVKATIVTLPDQKELWTQNFVVPPEDIQASTKVTKDFQIALSPNEKRLKKDMALAVEARGTLTYLDAFGDAPKQANFCRFGFIAGTFEDQGDCGNLGAEYAGRLKEHQH